MSLNLITQCGFAIVFFVGLIGGTFFGFWLYSVTRGQRQYDHGYEDGFAAAQEQEKQ